MQRLVINGEDGFGYRCTPKPITIRGGNSMARERLEATERHQQGMIDDTLLLSLPNLSLLRYGTLGVEKVALDEEGAIPPHDAAWEAIDLSNEDDYQDIPEGVLLEIVEGIMKANPHRRLEFDFLAKALELLQRTNESALPNSTPNGNKSTQPIPPDSLG